MRTWNPIPKPGVKKKAKKPIKKISSRLAKGLKKYSKLRAQYLFDNPYCQLWMFERGIRTVLELQQRGADVLQRCPRSTDIHHKRGRGRFLLDTSTWMAVSREGHEWIHHNPKEAYERGYMLKR